MSARFPASRADGHPPCQRPRPCPPIEKVSPAHLTDRLSSELSVFLKDFGSRALFWTA